MTKKILTLTSLVIILSLAIAACGADPQQALCSPLEQLTTPIENLSGVTADASAADVKALLETIDGPMQALETANQALNRERITELVTTYNELVAEVEALPEDAPLGESAPRLVAISEQVRSTFDQATSALNCSP